MPPAGVKYQRATEGHLSILRESIGSAAQKKLSLTALTDPRSFHGVLNASLVRQAAEAIISAHGFKGMRASIIQIGLSAGNNSGKEPQPIWAIELIPRRGPLLQPYVFTSGHHDCEYAGPQSALHLLNVVMDQLSNKNPKFQRMFGRHPMVFIPLANPDGALLEESDEFTGARFAADPLDEIGFVKDPNIYETYLEKKTGERALIWPEAAQIQSYLQGFISSYGTPRLTVDFHETSAYTGKIDIDNRRLNRYVYIAMKIANMVQNRDPALKRVISVDVDFVALSEAINKAVQLYGPSISDELIIGRPERHFKHTGQCFMGICEWLKSRGAENSYIIETPNVEHTFHVGDRVMLAMVAMEEILSEVKF